MHEENSIFGADPECLRRLMRSGLEDDEADEPKGTDKATTGNSAERPGARIGRYKLLRLLGEGGMGMVYLAEQEGAIRRRVALKVIKPGMDSARVIARFEAERQALALLDHPNIAQVYDAGTTESGRPYFVMEYAKGLPITEYCDRHRLTVEARLRLFQQVCHAVQHAHQKGIIHRDLKPSNILVVEENDRAVPKIIDFGVAKALSQPLTERTLYTEESRLLGTPEYMSPEQTDPANEDIDTRSDIYSLGVLLYELLTGILPFDSDALRTGGIEHMRETIRETDPKTPSTRLMKLGAEAKRLADSRRTEVTNLAKRLRQELEWIPLKALRKDRAERYRSASEMADDIDNYLKGAPLTAGPLTPGYRLRKFIHRHKTLAGSVAAVVLVSGVGAIVSTLFAIRAERARSQAEAVSEYLLQYVLDARNDGKLLDRGFEGMLDNAVEGLEGRFEDQPLIEAEIRYTLAQKYMEALNPEPAKLLLERAYQIRVQQFGPEDDRALQFAMNLGWAYSHLGQYDLAAQMWNEQIETFRRAYGDTHWRITLLLGSISTACGLLGDYEKAEACLDEALQRNPSTGRLFSIQRERGMIYLAQGRYAEAEEALRQALELERPPSVQRFTCMTTLSAVYRAQGRYEKAQQLCQTALDTMRENLGEDHWATLGAKCKLGRILMACGLLPEAEKLTSEALHSMRLRRTLPQDLPRFINALAVVRTKQGEYADANDLFAEALESRRHALGDDHPETLDTLNDFGVLRREQREFGAAEALLRQALQGRQRKLGPDHPACFESMHELALVYVEQENHEAAAPLLLDAYRGREAKLGPDHPHTIASLRELVHLYDAWGRPDDTEKWRAELLQRDEGKEQD
ncbi:MAG: tetratricopeptide repeat protein [Sedimentisphaerales bacterium]|nr:tetratricopeptide repeat protein [Sedimentisphaerales bacterium]